MHEAGAAQAVPAFLATGNAGSVKLYAPLSLRDTRAPPPMSARQQPCAERAKGSPLARHKG